MIIPRSNSITHWPGLRTSIGHYSDDDLKTISQAIAMEQGFREWEQAHPVEEADIIEERWEDEEPTERWYIQELICRSLP